MQNTYYVTNGMIVFIGMIDKLIGFKETWDKRKTVWVNFAVFFIGLFFIGWVLRGLERLEDKEMKHD